MLTRREFIKKTGILSATVFGSLLAAKGLEAKKGQKKNLLFIMTDQQRYEALSIAGNTILETPNLDHLAKEGAYFKNAYTPCNEDKRSSLLL